MVVKTGGVNELAVEGGAVAVAEVKATPTGQDVVAEGFAFAFCAHRDSV